MPHYTGSMLDEWSENMEHCWTDHNREKAKAIWEQSIQVSLCSLQILQGEPPNQTRRSAVRSWQLSTDLYVTNCCSYFTRKVKYTLKLSTFHGTVYKPPVRKGQYTYHYFPAISNVNKLMYKLWKLERIYSHPLSEFERLSNDRYI
jgi:hypothetical protein